MDFDIMTASMPWKQARVYKFDLDKDINLNSINELYSTNLIEEQRGTFEETFTTIDVSGELSYGSVVDGTWSKNNDTDDGIVFYSALNSQEAPEDYNDRIGSKKQYNFSQIKKLLCLNLEIDEETYDALACVALALASQETGMGNEKGYKSENTKNTIDKTTRDTGINGKNILGNIKNAFMSLFNKEKEVPGSASSGLTQLKIDDFLNDPEMIRSWYSGMMKQLGVESNSPTDNNLYEKPEYSAIATMFKLKTILDDYKDYSKEMDKYHDTLGEKLSQENEIDENKALEEGYNYVLDIYQTYENIDNEDEKVKFRNAVKGWIMAENETTLDEKTKSKSPEEILEYSKDSSNKYNEEARLNIVNDYLKKYSNNESQLEQSSLDYIRYFLTDEGTKMSPLEYLPHAWNTGADLNESNQLNKYDRFISTQMGIILSEPDIYNYDQFTPNVIELATKYAAQSTDDGYYALNDTLKDYFK